MHLNSNFDFERKQKLSKFRFLNFGKIYEHIC